MQEAVWPIHMVQASILLHICLKPREFRLPLTALTTFLFRRLMPVK